MPNLAKLFDDFFDKHIAPSFVNTWWNKLERTVEVERVPFEKLDLFLCVMMGLIGAAASVWGFMQTARAPGLFIYDSIYFQSDMARVADNWTDTTSSNNRAHVHPVASILIYPISHLLMFAGLSAQDATKAIVTAIAGLNASLMFAILRQLKINRWAGIVFSVLFIASASFIFWHSVIEFYPIGALSILCAIFLMAYSAPVKKLWWVLMSLFTLGITITNWAIGWIAAASRLNLKTFILIMTMAMGLAVGLSLVQKEIFAGSGYFFNPARIYYEYKYAQPLAVDHAAHPWDPVSNLRSVYVSTVVTPPANEVAHTNNEFSVTNQMTAVRKGDLAIVIGTAAWVALFGLGVWGAVSNRSIRPFVIGLGAMLAVQTLLHSVYGEITFLYSIHTLPILIIFAALSWYSRFRYPALVLAGLVITFGGYNNVREFQATIDKVAELSATDHVKEYQFSRGPDRPLGQ